MGFYISATDAQSQSAQWSDPSNPQNFWSADFQSRLAALAASPALGDQVVVLPAGVAVGWRDTSMAFPSSASLVRLSDSPTDAKIRALLGMQSDTDDRAARSAAHQAILAGLKTSGPAWMSPMGN